MLLLCNNYRLLNETLTKLDTKLQFDLTQSIWQNAIQGKLVPQDPNDKPIQIQCKNPIIRRDNSYYEIINGKEVRIDDEIPFEIPNSWTWLRGRDLFHKQINSKLTGKQFEYIDLDSIDNDKNVIRYSKTTMTEGCTSRARRVLTEGNVLFSTVRPYLRNIAIVTRDYSECIGSTGFFVCSFDSSIDTNYVYYMMLSDYVTMGLNSKMKGEKAPSISNDDIYNYLFPIPPINEQRKIASITKKLMSITNQLSY